MNWSGSKLSLIRLCGFAFAEDVIRKIPRPPHPALAGGSVAHAGIAQLVQAVVNGDPIDVRSIARRVAPGGPAEVADALGILIIMQEALADDPPPFEGDRVMYIEHRLGMPIGPHTFDGQSDLVQRYGRECTVDDWKTHFRPLSQEAFEADNQLPRYALLVDYNHPGMFDRFVLRQHFVRYRGAPREMVIEREQLDMIRWDLATDIEEAEQLVKEERFEATPGDWCTICSRTESCPVVKAFREHGLDFTMPDDAAATEAAAVVRAIDAHSARLKAQLKTFLGGDHPTGRVPLSGGSYGYGAATKRKASARDVLDVYEAHAQPINSSVLRVDVDQLHRSLDRAPGNMRRAMQATVEQYEQPDCRYRRGDNQEEEGSGEES